MGEDCKPNLLGFALGVQERMGGIERPINQLRTTGALTVELHPPATAPMIIMASALCQCRLDGNALAAAGLRTKAGRFSPAGV